MGSKKKKMKISEIFYSIQGEGKYTGVPSTFIRTSYCNLRCSWCDTPYTSHEPENKDFTVEETLTQVEKYQNRFHKPHFVLTGGEPYIQADQCYDLCKSLRNKYPGSVITVETNGTIFTPLNADLISISPKLKSSAPYKDQTSKGLAKAHERVRQNLQIDAFRRFYDCQFKFVISKLEDIDEILNIVESYKIPQQEVYLMPEGATHNKIMEKCEDVVKMCMHYGFNYSDRLHVRLWDEKRGV